MGGGVADRLDEAAMHAAILGWGSLLSDPRDLCVHGDWQPDGPRLPIEFARVSGKDRDRLTAVLFEGAEPIQTYWIRSGMLTLEGARENLRCREGCRSIDSIGYLTSRGRHQLAHFAGLRELLRHWLVGRPDLGAVLWTDLRSNFRERTGRDFSVDDGVGWLQNLIKDGCQGAAEDYIRRAPPQTDTPLRRRVREILGWADNWPGEQRTPGR